MNTIISKEINNTPKKRRKKRRKKSHPHKRMTMYRFYYRLRMVFSGKINFTSSRRQKYLRLGGGILTIAFLTVAFTFTAKQVNGTSEYEYASLYLPDSGQTEGLFYDIMDFDREKQTLPGKAGSEGNILPSLNFSSYTIKNGDTISEIAQKFNLRLDTLISTNNIEDVRKLKVGQKLRIPNIDGQLYNVQRGDNLSSISHDFSVSLNGILDVNEMESAVIQPGEKIFIPGAKMNTIELKRVLGELFIYPTNGRFTSGFGMRKDPFSGIRHFHNGIDLANDTGTRVNAALDGRVARIGINPTYGKYVIVSHANGYQTWYAHLSRILVSQGNRISQGYKLGEMGNTGYSTGSHLHFSVFKNGEPENPLNYLH